MRGIKQALTIKIGLLGRGICLAGGGAVLCAGMSGAALAQTETSFPTDGAALGGNMRAAPDSSAEQLAYLGKGEALLIKGRSAVLYQGYSWFEVEVRGTTGFVWGGVLCTDDAKLKGAFAAC